MYQTRLILTFLGISALAWGLVSTGGALLLQLGVLISPVMPLQLWFACLGALGIGFGLVTLIYTYRQYWSPMVKDQKFKNRSLNDAQRYLRFGAWEWDRNSGELVINGELLDICGLPEDAFDLGLPDFSQCLMPTEVEVVQKKLRAAIKGKTNFSFETRLQHADSDERPHVFITLAFRHNRHGKLTHVIGTVLDITQQKSQEASYNKLSAAIEQTNSSVIITDMQGVVEYVNAGFSGMTGFSEEEFVGGLLNQLPIQEEVSDSATGVKQAFSKGQRWRGEIRSKRRDGSTYWMLVSLTPIRIHSDSPSHMIVVCEDINDLKSSRDEMEKMAFYDALTGLGNRRLFRDRLSHGIKSAQRKNNALALLYLDLDNFKRVNDTLGHDAGDALLKTVAKRLCLAVRDSDSVARIGGDEFTLLLYDIDDESHVSQVAQKIIEALSQPIKVLGQEVIITPSIGITVSPRDGIYNAELLKNADLAMYQAKQSGRNNFQYYSPNMNNKAIRHLVLENDLRHAITSKEMYLVYQPQIDLKTETIVGAEALIRWNHPERGLVSPTEFIPVAEESALILPIGAKVVYDACFQAAAFEKMGAPIKIAINISARQLSDGDIVSVVKNALDQSGVSPCYIEVEITESMLMDINAAIPKLEKIRDFGISVAIDDFGTGYSSLSYLRRFPLDKLKIDRSFVKDIPDNRNDKDIVAAVIAMAHKLNLQVLAEGVETAEQQRFLNENGCEFIQGYYYHRPMKPEKLQQLLSENQKTVQTNR